MALAWFALAGRKVRSRLLVKFRDVERPEHARATEFGRDSDVRRNVPKGLLRAPQLDPRERPTGAQEKHASIQKKRIWYLVIQDSPAGSGVIPAGRRKLVPGMPQEMVSQWSHTRSRKSRRHPSCPICFLPQENAVRLPRAEAFMVNKQGLFLSAHIVIALKI